MQKIFAVLVLVLGFSGAWVVESIYSNDGNFKAEGYKNKFYVKLVIIPYSDYNGYPSHFYVIVGIKMVVESDGNKIFYYLLRDVALDAPKSIFFDEIQEINYFYDNAMGNSNNSSIKPVINVLPGKIKQVYTCF